MGKIIAGRYAIESELGQGGMGVVYKAWDNKLQCAVALKAVSPSLIHNEDARRRILREARTAASLNHPYICKIFDTVEDEGLSYVVMEYCEGRTLEDVTMDPAEATGICIEIAEALQEAANRGIVHRDLKPANIMLTRSGHVKVMDFGLAKYVAKGSPAGPDVGATGSLAITAEGQIVGSTPYMSPEQLRGEPLDERSDIFSLGIVMYELLTGHRPFYGGTTAEVIASILSDEPEPITRYRRGIPGRIEQVVMRMLAKDRTRRYASASHVREGLLKTLEVKDRVPSGESERRLSWRYSLLAAAAVVAVAVSVAIWDRMTLRKTSDAGKSQDLSAGTGSDVLFHRATILSNQLSSSANRDAIALLQECIRLDPESAAAHSELALEKLKKFWWYQGDASLIGEASQEASYALKLDPKLVQARAIRAICETLGSPDPAGYLELGRCLRERPAQQEALAWLTMFFMKAGEFDLAKKLIDRLQEEHPDSPYTPGLKAGLFTSIGDYASARNATTAMQLKFPSWDGAAYAQKERAIKLQDMTLLEQAIKELSLVNPQDPALEFWKAYLNIARGSIRSLAEVRALEPYLAEDFELAAFYAQMSARLGDKEEALRWLEHSINKGNYDILQLDHSDFRELQPDPRFVRLKDLLKQNAATIIARLRPMLK